jgi:transposase
MAMKGFQVVAEMILVSELGEIHRFAHPQQVMAYLGLIPTKTPPTSSVARTASPKCNAHVRWLLIESAQHYITPPETRVGFHRSQNEQAS